MYETEKERQNLLHDFNLSQEQFVKANVSWDLLSEIAEDYNRKKIIYKKEMREIVKCFEDNKVIHSIGSRGKETDHLIAKIIRKNMEYAENGRGITLENYDLVITDLMGIRILHLFKEDWEVIHKDILERFGGSLKEAPKAYVRKGDYSSHMFEGKIQIDPSRNYRSVHYVVITECMACVEIQVRTVFEEGWAEVDHILSYPHNLANGMLNEYMGMLSHVTGLADEMNSFLKGYKDYFEQHPEEAAGSEKQTVLFRDIFAEFMKGK